jgi:hypothetical protein
LESTVCLEALTRWIDRLWAGIDSTAAGLPGDQLAKSRHLRIQLRMTPHPPPLRLHFIDGLLNTGSHESHLVVGREPSGTVPTTPTAKRQLATLGSALLDPLIEGR